MADPINNQGPEHILVDPPERDIHVDVHRSQQDVRTSAEWLVLFKGHEETYMMGIMIP